MLGKHGMKKNEKVLCFFTRSHKHDAWSCEETTPTDGRMRPWYIGMLHLNISPNASLRCDVLHFDANGALELGNKMFQFIEKKKF